ncbi:CoA ester lyase [Afifella sp. IM 167]|uniref:HpcH/HpaI aldolase/citrate lyase family protein n=1 Tax=Afifella sp. IM 167 TaxID=2033586 RepID=UPI001CCEBC0E|nr:CoA ester lyase [Afifella sp. IM 167]MBZ8134803.1 CoA ester lyase [Afifella sp. IM 167]
MTYQRPRRLRRVQLATPASSEKMMAKAATSAADHVFLDLEDAVAPSAKAKARGMAVEALRNLDWGTKTRCVRINDLTTRYAYEDIIEVVTGAREHLDTIMIPKVITACDVRFVATLLNQIEMNIGLEKKIGIELLIEEAAGLQNVVEICQSDPRLECVIFGLGDYSASQGVGIRSGGDHDYPGDLWHYPRFKLAMAARAAGIDPVDGPYGNYGNEAVYREEARRAAIIGCVGKWAIHPSQIQPALDVFTPAQEDVDFARKMAREYARAEAEGLGAVSVDGVMVDVATVRMLQNTLDKAELIGM